MELRTDGCRANGHPEIILRWSLSEVPVQQIEAVIRYLSGAVAAGTQFKAGQTLLLGGRLTRFVVEGADLALEELEYAVTPLAWKAGVDDTMWELVTQRFTAESYGLLEDMEFARGDQLVLQCTKARVGRFTLTRRDPEDDEDSGWFLGCTDDDHDHDHDANLTALRVHELIAQRAALVRYLALPTDTSVRLAPDGLRVLYEGARMVEREHSYMAAVRARAAAGEFDLDASLLGMIDRGELAEAIALTCERYLCVESMAREKAAAYAASRGAS